MRILNLAVHSCFTRFNDVKLKNRQIENGVEFGLRCHAEGPREIREGIRKKCHAEMVNEIASNRMLIQLDTRHKCKTNVISKLSNF